MTQPDTQSTDTEPVEQPPHDLEAEAAVLSAIMLDLGAMMKLADWMRAEMFYSEAHRWIFEAAMALFEAREPTDVKLIASWLKNHERIAQVGGLAYLMHIVDASPAVANVVAHAKVIHDRWRRRVLIAATQRIAARGYVEARDAQEQIDEACKTLERLAREAPGEKAETNLEILTRMVKAAQETIPTSVRRGIRTGIHQYDKATGGLHSGVTLIVARTGRGKSTLALQIAENVTKQGFGVMYVTMEQDRDEMLMKLVAGRARIEVRRVRDAMRGIRPLETHEVPAFMTACSEIGPLPLWFEHHPHPTASWIRNRVLMKQDNAMRTDKTPLGLVVIDHIHRMGPEQSYERTKYTEQLRHMAQAIKSLATETGLPILVCAQMKNLEKDQRSQKPVKPSLDCVAWCQDIERESDNMLCLWTPNAKEKTHVEATTPKVRIGDSCDVKLTFSCERFYEDGADVDDTMDPMLATSRAWVDQTPEPPEGFFTEDES